MRAIKTHLDGGLNELIQIEPALDPNAGGGVNRYQTWYKTPGGWEHGLKVQFNDKTWADAQATGPDGLTNEALLAVLVDRLQGFQAGPCACRENACAITHLQEALFWLKERTRGRLERGVLGERLA